MKDIDMKSKAEDIVYAPTDPLVQFERNGLLAAIDFKNGELVYSGEIPINESAKLLIEYLSKSIPAEWFAERARAEARNQALEETAARLGRRAAEEDAYSEGHKKAGRHYKAREAAHVARLFRQESTAIRALIAPAGEKK